MRRHLATYLALGTVSVAQPVLDLYTKNPTVFSAAKLSPAEIVVFWAGVLLAPALSAAALDRFSSRFGPRVNESVRLVIVGAFSGLLGLALARWTGINSDAGALGLATLLVVVVPWSFDRFRPVRMWSRWLSVLAAALAVTSFLDLRPLILPVAGAGSDARLADHETPVFFLVLDEFPLSALLGPGGEIDAERYPGFAALAAGSTWYRDTLAVSNFTHQAVPAVLASSMPVRDGGPFAFTYPRNIFTLYADATRVEGTEPVTALCPVRVCGGESGLGSGFSPRRMKGFLSDVAVVYGQRVLPPTMRRRLPAVDGGWGGFAAVRERFKREIKAEVFGQRDAVTKGAEEFAAAHGQVVKVVHALVPHAPWRLLPDGRVAPLSPEITTENPEDEDGTRDTYQAFLHQVAAVDAVLADAISAIKKAGRWDDSMIVVTADHGISFLPGMPQRNTEFLDAEQYEDVYRIPTFVKYPGQASGTVSDCAASNLDLLPTVNDVLGVTTSWGFAGRSLAGGCPQGRQRTVVAATGESLVMTSGFAAARERGEYYGMLVPHTGPSARIAAVGNAAGLVGTSPEATEVSRTVASWTLATSTWFDKIDGRPGTLAPATVHGTVTLSGPVVEGTEGLVTLDGQVAGIIGEMAGQEGTFGFTAVLDHTMLTAGHHSVELLVRDENGVLTRVGPPRN